MSADLQEATLAGVRAFAARSKRSEIPVRRTFVRRDSGSGVLDDPPLARLLRGGQGGRVKVATYLALIWQCSAEPYDTTIKASALAVLLGLPKPATNGARRVQDALQALSAAQLIHLNAGRGRAAKIVLLDESGTNRPYVAPATAHADAVRRRASNDVQRQHLYFRVSTQWWTYGAVQGLSGAGLAMLLILLAADNPNNRDVGVWISPTGFKTRYGLSVDTRQAGLKELKAHDLVVPIEQMQDSFFDVTRRRVFYRLQTPDHWTAGLTDPEADPVDRVVKPRPPLL